MGIWLATREDVKRALDIAETARTNSQVDRAIESASRSVEGQLKRRFYPLKATRFFDWPDRTRSRSWRLWLNGQEVISVDTLTAGGTEIASTDYFLDPDSGPPFNAIETRLDQPGVFTSGDTHQRAIQVDGLFGYNDDETQVGELTGSLGAADDDTASVGWTDPNVGVGNILRIGNERMIITGRSMVDTTQNLGGALTASKADTSVPVSDGTAFDTDMILLVESERMLIVDIAGNTLTVKRGWDGSVLASHSSGTDVFALTGVQLDRGKLGTTAAAHSSGAAIWRHDVPGLVRELCIAEALNTLAQEQSGYARTVGSGESERLIGGRGLADIRKEARQRFGRKARIGAI